MENTLGKRIKYLREEKKFSQLEFSKLLNINNSTLSQYEAGNRMPGDEIKKKIAEYFNVSLDYLMGVSDIRNPYLNTIIKSDGDNELRDDFKTPEEAIDFLLNKNVIMSFGGFDVNDLTDEEKIDFAHDLLQHLKLLSLKYKK